MPGLVAPGMRKQGSDADSNNSCVNCSGHPPVAVQSRSAGKFLKAKNREQGYRDDKGNAPSPDDSRSQRSHNQPGTIRPPNITHILPEEELDQANDPTGAEQHDDKNRDVGPKNRILNCGRKGHQMPRSLAFNAGMIRPRRCMIVSIQPTMTTRHAQSSARSLPI